MNTLNVKPWGDEFAVFLNGKQTQTVAIGIPEQFMAKQFSCVPELIDAAVFAASVLKSSGMFDLSEKMAVVKLELALHIAGITVKTPATRDYDAFGMYPENRNFCTVETIKDESVTTGVHYRVTDACDNRIATCYSVQNAELVAAALNAVIQANPDHKVTA